MARAREPRGMGALLPASAPPPWLLGWRGAPLEAPENTHASLARALALGLDGVAYDVRRCASGELVLHADATLERTSDGHGAIGERTIADLTSLDAGGWFGAQFQGEPLALLEEALRLRGGREHGPPMHLAFVHEHGTASAIADVVHARAAPTSIRIASRSREICGEARDSGLSALWIVADVGEETAEIARRERFAALGASASAWLGAEEARWAHGPEHPLRPDSREPARPASPSSATGGPPVARELGGVRDWPAERWCLGAHAPGDLLALARVPLFAIVTHEPVRALAARALAALVPDLEGPWPVRVPVLDVVPGSIGSARGAWCGSWSEHALVSNPFTFPVHVRLSILPRRGAFDISGLPAEHELAPGAELRAPFTITGGSSRPGGDPLVGAHFSWGVGPGRAAGGILCDAPLTRVRRLVADALPHRIELLRESPHDGPASMVVRRQRGYLLVSIEDDDGHRDAKTIVRIEDRTIQGGRGVRVRLPHDFDQRVDGIPFSCGFVTRRDGERLVRRWCGGVPEELESGLPGILTPARLG